MTLVQFFVICMMMVSCEICFLSSLIIFWVERQYLKAGVSLTILAILSWTGVIHAFQITDSGIENRIINFSSVWIAAPEFTISYGIAAAVMFIVYGVNRVIGVSKRKQTQTNQALVLHLTEDEEEKKPLLFDS